MEHEKILNLLIKAGFLKEEDARRVLKEKNEDEDIFQTLLRLNILSEKDIMNFFQRKV